jgi:hypothetical protein
MLKVQSYELLDVSPIKEFNRVEDLAYHMVKWTDCGLRSFIDELKNFSKENHCEIEIAIEDFEGEDTYRFRNGRWAVVEP